MNCATTNAFFVNEKLLFRNDIIGKLNDLVYYRCPIVKCQHLMLKYVQV